ITAGRFEHGGRRCLTGAGSHCCASATASAGRETEGVEQDGLAGTRLAGQHIETRRELQARLLDEHDVANGQRREHSRNGCDDGWATIESDRSYSIRPKVLLSHEPWSISGRILCA